MCQKLDFGYDSQGRRVSKTVSTSTNGTTWTFLSNQRFLYDGWNLIAEYSATETAPNILVLQATHTWGIDLSSSPQGAGGVGGLLSSTLITTNPITSNSYFPAYDGNGNISAWIDGTGTLLGRMDYSPFGQLIAQYKFTAAGNTTLSRLAFGFSTKYTDVETGLLYYVLRYYDPVTGRWLSRDPIGEKVCANIYVACANDGVSHFDVKGMYVWTRVDDDVFRNTIADGLMKVAKGSELYWEEMKDEKGKLWCLKSKKAGSVKVWTDLKGGIDPGKKIWIEEAAYVDNAHGRASFWVNGKVQEGFVKINRNPNISLPVEPPKWRQDGLEQFDRERASFAAILWHELVGHTILGVGHPNLPDNNVATGAKNVDPNYLRIWAKYMDPTIKIENEARTILKEKQRAGWYYGW